ncbi:MAG: 50S ribosomal protein L24 [Deltaproteobacteria bacterium]|nr:50S ribosomal protein L24 [Deltaproteobacteria bacterium]
MKAQLKKDDKVIVISGKHKGDTGAVLSVDRERGRVLIDGVNKVKRHMKPGPGAQEGSIKEVERPLPLAKVAKYIEKDGGGQ